ncbi:MAG: phosphoribosylamine--glycine ligase [Alphaproteobacteria bacterium]|jgi:phosphoribosylamine--glycine ligase|nr:phosphoribosylamine--glycine ligase [Alphaproteobacteria bacterium]
MNVLVVGSGGREHALVWALAASPLVDALYCAPGNGGIQADATCVDIDAMDADGIVGFCRSEEIEFVVVGPEQPLVAGLVDRLDAAGIKAFGPSAAAAQLEGSKAFTKDLCAAHGIPTAPYRCFRGLDAAKAYIEAEGAPIVVKADGLAAGKGAIVCESVAEATAAAEAILGGQFGAAGAEIVVEGFLDGEEASFFALADGRHVLPLATAQDHKRVGDGDTGPNTGGMGAYSPAPVMTEAMVDQTMNRIILPTVEAMAAAGRPFKGVLYAGLMITAEGPQLIEYNVRFGDPEAQVLMPRLRSDLLPALIACADGVLDHADLRWREEAALTVVMAADGYPGAYHKGSEIRNLAAAGELPDITIFHAGTRADGGRIYANGGRVLGVTALGPEIATAKARAYEAVDVIDWPAGFCRRDIGWRVAG